MNSPGEYKINPLLLCDGYKTGHHKQYPDATSLVYANFTPRNNKHAPRQSKLLVSFGQQMVMRQIHDLFQQNFFNRSKEEVCGEMKHELSLYLNTDYNVSHFESLHDLGYLPIRVKIIEEGSLVPVKIPVLTIVNTKSEFYWVTNYLETIISTLLWKPMTSATIAYLYRKLCLEWQQKTDTAASAFVDWQAHDFSMRGLDAIDAAINSGLGHAINFSGSDTLPVIFGARKYYYETGFVVGSVNATEHSVMCAGSKEGEIETFRRLLKIYPTGILSIVSDTWDLWKVCTEYLVTLKDEIVARNGKLVIRPDSGDPVDIICGRQIQMSHGIKVISPEIKGVIELLWDIFGGTINEQGYKVLDPHIGAIYGDSITLERAEQIFARLEAKGFASTNIVLGIGSFTYQYNTRDSFGFAMKATYVEVNGEGREIFKDPITDDGVKKSAKGLLKVVLDNGEYKLYDQQDWHNEAGGALTIIYEDGKFKNQTTLTRIRTRLREYER